MEGTVALRGQANAATFLGNLDAVLHRLNVSGLLPDGNGRHQPGQQLGYPADGKNILRGNIIKRLAHGHGRKKLIKSCLMVHHHQILSAIFLLKFFNLNAILPGSIGSNNRTKQRINYLMPGLNPGIRLAHMGITLLSFDKIPAHYTTGDI